MRVYVDFKSPAAYLALVPTLDLAARYNQDVRWLPFKTHQQGVTAAPSADGAEDKGTRHRRVRALARQNTHLLYAGLRGLKMNFPAQPGETDLALAALSALGSHPRVAEYVQLAFEKYWVDSADLNNPSVVGALLAAIDVTYDDNFKHQTTMHEAANLAEADGVVGTPAYVIQDQLFIGREHLPWIERLMAQGFC